MEAEKANEVDADFPWMSCVMGCRPTEDKEVNLLKCLHVICSSTCNENWKNQLNSKEGSLPYCPLCRILVKEEDLKEKVILKKLFPPKLTKDNVKLTCDMCIDNLPATTFCPTCPHYLCEICTKTHFRIRSTFNHNLETNLDQRREIEFQIMLEKQNLCKVEGHAASPTTKYCITCQQKLCDQCTMHDASHKIMETEKGKELFIANLKAAQELYQKVEESIEKTQTKRSEFSPQKCVSISSKITNDFALINRILKKCQELIIAEVGKTFERRRTDLSDLETRLEFLKKKIAHMCKAYESVQDNLGEAATCYLSHLASESRDFVTEIVKNGHVDMVEDSNEFSLDPTFMKSVLSRLEQGPVKITYELDLKNIDETVSTLLDESPQAQDAGGDASSDEDIIVTSVSSLNPYAPSPPKTRRIVVKSREEGDGRHLGMMHLERTLSLIPGDACGSEHVSNEETSKEETADKIELDSPSKTSGVEGPNEANENGGKDNGTATFQSLGITPNGTSLSDSSDKVAAVRVGLRKRKKTIYQDFVDPTKDIMFSMNEDTEDTASSASLIQGLDDAWSENGFESGTESDLSVPSSKRQSLRKRGDSIASASGPSTPALHTVQNPFQCRVCSKSFTHSFKLIIHERTHTGEKPYRCGICEKKFANLANLNNHILVTHSKLKPFSCVFCEKRFGKKDTLFRHLRSHNDERPIICTICQEEFSQPYLMRAHVKMIHKK